MLVDLTRHEKHAADLVQKLNAIYRKIPFDKAVNIAIETVKEMAATYPDRVIKGRWTRSAGKGDSDKGHEVAFDHFGEYFGFKYPDKNGETAQVALGYDSRHWTWTGDERIPWRVFLSSIAPITSPDLPEHVEKKIRRKSMRDGFTWVYYESPLQGRDYTFILIERVKKLPAEGDPEYVKKLAKVVYEFLDELYVKKRRT